MKSEIDLSSPFWYEWVEDGFKDEDMRKKGIQEVVNEVGQLRQQFSGADALVIMSQKRYLVYQKIGIIHKNNDNSESFNSMFKISVKDMSDNDIEILII